MSFRNRLALFLMATLVCVQAATAIFAYAFLRGQIIERGKRELSDAMQSFTRQVDFLSQRATDGVQVLALDYALRSAIGKSDHDTELSVLHNHGRRIGAARMMLVRLDGTISADTAQSRNSGGKFPFAALLGTAAESDRGTALVTLGNQVDWMIVVPVRAPLPIAFIAASIPLDNTLLDEIRRASSSPHPIVLAAKTDNFPCLRHGEENSASEHWSNLVQTVFERSHHAQVTSAAAHAPEKIFILVAVRSQQSATSGDHIKANDVGTDHLSGADLILMTDRVKCRSPMMTAARESASLMTNRADHILVTE